MKNLLIIEDNLVQSYFMVNHICKELKNIRLYSIVTTGREAIKIIDKKQVDIIILDLNLPDMTGIDIINYMDRNNMQDYHSSIIIVTGEMDLLSQVSNNKYVYTYCSKLNLFETLIDDIKQLLYLKEKTHKNRLIKEQIINELQQLNFNFSYSGTKYLCDCIEECSKKGEIYNINLKKDIYSILSKKYNKTISSIKSSIFKAISEMYYNSDEKDLSNYFKYRIIMKPKTRDIISIILQKIK